MADLRNHDPLVEAVAKARKESSRRPERRDVGVMNSTLNGNNFYIYSGVIPVPTTETTMISIPNVGDRDILIKFQIGSLAASSVDTFLKVLINKRVVYQNAYSVSMAEYINDVGMFSFIVSANTQFEITLRSDSSSQDWTVAAWGDYL